MKRTRSGGVAYFNCSYLIDPSGDVILKYRRINTVHTASPHDFMDAYLDKYGLEGTFPVSKTPLGNIAMMPCGEIMYPESARMFMFRGAEVLLHPTSDHGAADKWAWESAKKVRASENMMYLVSTNATGQIGTFIPEGQTLGNSKIIDYHGRVLENVGGPGESTVASATIDVEALRRERRIPGAGNRLLRQRIEMYRPLYNQTSFYPPNQFADAPMDFKTTDHGNTTRSAGEYGGSRRCQSTRGNGIIGPAFYYRFTNDLFCTLLHRKKRFSSRGQAARHVGILSVNSLKQVTTCVVLSVTQSPRWKRSALIWSRFKEMCATLTHWVRLPPA